MTKRLLINKKWILLVFLTMPYLKTGYIANEPFLNDLYNIWRIVSIVCLSIIILSFRASFKTADIIIVLMEISLLIVTCIRNGDVNEAFTDAISTIGIVLLYEWAVEDWDIFISSQLFCYEMYIYINLLTEVLYPETMYVSSNGLFITNKCWFLGFYNNHSVFFIPAILFALLWRERTGHNKRFNMLMIAIAISAIKVWSGGVIISLLSMLIIGSFINKRKIIIDFFRCWLLHIGFLILFIVMKIQNAFIWIIQDFLGKGRSLELRNDLWDKTIELIKVHPYIGWGIWSGLDREMQLKLNWGVNSHNFILEILYRGGLLYFILFSLLVIMVGFKIRKSQNRNYEKIVIIAFCGWVVASFVEAFISPLLIGMLIVALNVENVFCKQ